jgi:hypothetical protein
MPGKQVQRRRGSTAQHAIFTGAIGEVTVDTDKKVGVVHDGTTPGGFPLASARDVVTLTTAINEAQADADAANANANGLRADLNSTVDPDKGSALLQWLLEYTGAVALRQDLKNAERVSVAVFGVTGVGDDTLAMQKAIAWQLDMRDTWQPSIGGGLGSAVVNCPVLTVPNGWHVKAQGLLEPPCFMVSEGRSSLESLDNTKDFFKGSDSYKVYLGYLNFVGGKSQVNLQNANINSGTWTCDTCTFEGANDYAVQFLNTSGAVPVTATQGILINCNFIRCKRMVRSQCDHTFHLGGWIQPEADFFDTDTSVIWVGGLYSMNWTMLIPGGTFPARSRWFDVWGAVRGIQNRFGGEGGGLPVVYWFATPTRYNLGTAESIEMGVAFDQCTIYAGNAARLDRGIINCRGQLPPIVRITNSVNGITCPYIVNESGANGGIPDLAAYLTNLRALWNNDDLHYELGYHFTGNKKKWNGNVLWPAELDTYVYTDKAYVPRKAKVKTSTSTSTVATGTTVAISLDGVDYDAYGFRFQEGVNWGIRAPLGAKFANVSAYIELATHASNNLIYTAKIYRNNALIPDLQADVVHSATGVQRVNLSGRVSTTLNESFTLRFFQNSGGPLTVTLASMEITFD